ncbi:hypothetical protein GW916_12335 [bacterium]|nr:hypothetical protein [bacterium]
MILFIALISLSALFPHALGDSVQCKPNITTDRLSEIKDLSQHIKEASQDSPFEMACKKSGNNLSEPKVSFLGDQLPKEDSNGVLAKEFFNEVLDRIEYLNKENSLGAKNLNYCTGEGSEIEDCKDLKNWSENILVEEVKDARYHLSLSQDPKSLASGFGRASLSINRKLSSPSFHKELPWSPLTKSESQLAEETLREYVNEIKQDLSNGSFSCSTEKHKRTPNKCLNLELQNIRRDHSEQYEEILTKAPILQFISSDHPTLSDVHAASKEIQNQLEKESKNIAELRDLVNNIDVSKKVNVQSGGRTMSFELIGGMPPKLAEIFRYNHLVEGFLLNNPKYCGIASALKKKMTYNDLKQDLSVIVPTLAISIFGTPLAGVLAGGAASGHFVTKRWKEYDLEKNITLSEIVGEKGKTPKDLVKIRKDIEFELAMVLAPGGGIPFLKMGKRAVKTARSLKKRR